MYQNKVASSLAAIHRPGDQADNGKMVYYLTNQSGFVISGAYQPGYI